MQFKTLGLQQQEGNPFLPCLSSPGAVGTGLSNTESPWTGCGVMEEVSSKQGCCQHLNCWM